MSSNNAGKRRYFGTDGVRGIVPDELTPELALHLGAAAQRYLGEKLLNRASGSRPGVSIIGTDTRISSDCIRAAVVSGIMAAGGTVLDAGICPTPGVSYLVGSELAAFGTVISASHNPFQYNGIKFFDSSGYKLSDEDELAIEELLERYRDGSQNYADPEKLGSYFRLKDGVPKYARYIAEKGKQISKRLRILFDCANGATSIATMMFAAELGLNAEFMCTEPNGKNINDSCGATDTSRLQERVAKERYDVGIAFDGDGDRVIVVDENGKMLSGDHIIAFLARHLCEPGSVVVGTVMSNLGMENYLKSQEIRFLRAPVGDRYVLELMLKNNATIGGEESGHIILLEHAKTGDGLLTAALFLNLISVMNMRVSEARLFELYPQARLNIETDQKEVLQKEKLKAELDAISSSLATRGRVVVRPSGTEPLIRIMVEAETEELAEKTAQDIKTVIEKYLQEN